MNARTAPYVKLAQRHWLTLHGYESEWIHYKRYTMHAEHSTTKHDLPNAVHTLAPLFLQAHDALSLANRSAAAEAEGAMAELRTQLKMKAFELQRLGTAHDELRSALKHSQAESDMLRQKLQVVQEEFVAMDGDRRRQVMELETQLAGEVRCRGVTNACRAR